jgi:hypothetical protein
MAYYKHSQFLTSNTHAAFDQLLSPGARTPFSGIYRCEHCGQEDVSEVGKPLPPVHNHKQAHQKVLWRLIVATHV